MAETAEQPESARSIAEGQPSEERKASDERKPTKKKKRKLALEPAVAKSTTSKWEWRTRAVAAALVIGLAAGGTGGYFLAQRMARSAQRPVPGPTYVKIEPWNPRQGPEHAKVTIIEFSDFQCPYCEKARTIVKEVVASYGDEVALIYRHRPLDMHKDARGAALAMQAAARQGKAWEMHDKMFDSRKDLSRASLERFAEELGLDVGKFKADMDDAAVAGEIAADEKAADAANASGTPTFFVNGRRLVGAKPNDEFKRVIDEELKKAEELLAAGTPIAEVYEKLAKSQKVN